MLFDVTENGNCTQTTSTTNSKQYNWNIVKVQQKIRQRVYRRIQRKSVSQCFPLSTLSALDSFANNIISICVIFGSNCSIWNIEKRPKCKQYILLAFFVRCCVCVCLFFLPFSLSCTWMVCACMCDFWNVFTTIASNRNARCEQI